MCFDKQKSTSTIPIPCTPPLCLFSIKSERGWLSLWLRLKKQWYYEKKKSIKLGISFYCPQLLKKLHPSPSFICRHFPITSCLLKLLVLVYLQLIIVHLMSLIQFFATTDVFVFIKPWVSSELLMSVCTPLSHITISLKRNIIRVQMDQRKLTLYVWTGIASINFKQL